MSDRIRLRYTNTANGARLSAKETLGVVNNGWLNERQIKEARAMAADPNVTEEQAEAALSRLEDDASGAFQMWRNCQ